MSLTFSDQQAIISLCEIHPESRKYDFGKCVAFKSYFVKFGLSRDLEFQHKTQEYIHSMTLNDLNAPRVPSVVDYFAVDPNKAYLVMEFIDGTTPTNDAHKEVADALQWLRNVPTPTDAKIGSIGGGPARHDIFLDFRAPLLFTSNEALQNYMNEVSASTLTWDNSWLELDYLYKALRWLPASPKPADVNFSNDKLVFSQSEISERNFLVDENGKICILNFQDITLLPESFATYTVNKGRESFVKGVAGYLDWTSPNEDSMQWARRFVQVAIPTLGTSMSPLTLLTGYLHDNRPQCGWAK